MADLSKNTQVVSNHSATENVSVCPLISPDSSCDVLSAVLHKESEMDLLEDGSSLQELIDSELAFRVASSVQVQGQEDDIEGHAPEVTGYDSPESNDVNTQFLMAERKSCFENSTNATHFFTLIDDEEGDPEADSAATGVGGGAENGVDDVELEPPLLDLNDSNNCFDLLKSPIEVPEDSLQGSPISPISPIGEDIIRYSSTFGETIVESPGEEVVEGIGGDLVEPDDEGSAGSPGVGKDKGQFDPTWCDSREDSSEEPSVNGHAEAEVVPFQDFFTPIPEDVDDVDDVGFPNGVASANGEVGLGSEEGSDSPDGFDPLSVGGPPYSLPGDIDTGESEPGRQEHESVVEAGEASAERLGTQGEEWPLELGEEAREALVAHLDADASHEAPHDAPVDAPHEAPADAPYEAPADAPADVPDDAPASPEDPVDGSGEAAPLELHDLSCDVHVCSTNSDDASSSSDLENNESLTTSVSEKKMVKKKKKAEGGDATKTKKTKKTKKEEKENISVTTPGSENVLTPIDTNIESESGSKIELCDELNELSSVSVKDLKSSFSKFDQLSKKTVLHVRSVDASKVQKQFNQSASSAPELTSDCRACGKQVFQMEQVKAERAIWHKNCFRCKECNKQLNVDNYSSHEGVLYCKPHFKELFKPKAVLEDEEPHVLRRPKMIICENQPVELPPEVVRASDKPDLGLEELTALNVKSRFQAFEKTDPSENGLERSPSSIAVKRSPSILSKLARFQAKGMDIGIADEELNSVPYEESSSSSEEEQEKGSEEQEKGVIRANRKQRERPMSFNKMGDIKCRWEAGHTNKDERREERKQEIQNIRSRLFMGKQGKMKEMYEQAVQESERGTQKKDVDIRSEKAKSIKEKFERGEVIPDDDDDYEMSKNLKKTKDDDLSIFEEGISKKSRSLFLELDAKTQQQPPMSPLKSPTPREEVRKAIKEISPQVSKDVVKATDAVEDVKVETAEVLNKFKFFETYKEPEREKRQFRITPPREGQVKEKSPETEIYRDPSVVRSEDRIEDEIVRTKTTSKMLSLFRQMEENASKEEVPEGPKPLKRFTPPPDYTHESETSEEENSDEEEEEDDDEEEEEMNPNIVRASDKVEDEFLKQAATAARAKALRAKFERWEEKENKLNSSSSGCNLDFDQSDQPSIDSTKSLRAKFESLKNEKETPKERNRPKVNRFVEIQAANTPLCFTCHGKVYPLEKIETSGKIFHKQCFRCLQCHCVLRMDSYTFNNEKLYCLPHFKQLFISKGNYEEGFGFDQHKRKWNVANPGTDIFND